MCEPLSVGIHACRRANVGPETNVLIMGAGPIGLVTMLAARAFGARRIVIVDVDDHRLRVAMSLGADGVVVVSPNIQVPSLVLTSPYITLARSTALYGADTVPCTFSVHQY